MLQDILDEPGWTDLLTSADRRGLTPLFWLHVLPYGEINLDMTSRLDLRSADGLGAHELAAYVRLRYGVDGRERRVR